MKQCLISCFIISEASVVSVPGERDARNYVSSHYTGISIKTRSEKITHNREPINDMASLYSILTKNINKKIKDLKIKDYNGLAKQDIQTNKTNRYTD